MAGGRGLCPAGHRAGVAAPPVSDPLGPAEPKAAGAARRELGTPDADPGPLGSQSALEGAPHARRTAETGDCRGEIHGRRIASARAGRPPHRGERFSRPTCPRSSHWFFTVPPGSFNVLFVLIVLAHDRRRILPFHVTEHPTAQWTAPHWVEACPWTPTPRSRLRDRDAVYGQVFARRVAGLGLAQGLTAPRSPWRIRMRNG